MFFFLRFDKKENKTNVIPNCKKGSVLIWLMGSMVFDDSRWPHWKKEKCLVPSSFDLLAAEMELLCFAFFS